MRLSLVAAVGVCVVGLSIADHVRALDGNGDGASAGSSTTSDQGVGLEEIVTATRQARLLSTVPISASAFSQKTLDAQGVNQIDDIAQLTPGVTLHARQQWQHLHRHSGNRLR